MACANIVNSMPPGAYYFCLQTLCPMIVKLLREPGHDNELFSCDGSKPKDAMLPATSSFYTVFSKKNTPNSWMPRKH